MRAFHLEDAAHNTLRGSPLTMRSDSINHSERGQIQTSGCEAQQGSRIVIRENPSAVVGCKSHDLSICELPAMSPLVTHNSSCKGEMVMGHFSHSEKLLHYDNTDHVHSESMAKKGSSSGLLA
jgi:hypothetical protein